jgi:ABC-type lipoprotein export system ATPase subunit
MIRLKDVSRVYARGGDAVAALQGVSLEIPAGEFVAVTGPSGCGKSTLLNLLGGLDSPDEGEIWVGDLELHRANDADLTRYRRYDLGVVFQFFNLLPAMTVAENVELPLLLRGDPAGKARLRVDEALALAGLTGRTEHYPHQLSGGEMQRAALARALAGRPKLLLADEPTGNLDSANAAHVMETLQKIAAQKQTTLIVVTHSEELAKLAPRRVAMRDGRVAADERSGAGG